MYRLMMPKALLPFSGKHLFVNIVWVNLFLSSENEIVDASSSSPNNIPRSKDRVVCMTLVYLVCTSSERLIESIESDRLDIKSAPSKAKAK